MKRLFPEEQLEPIIREIQLPASLEACYRRISVATQYSSYLNSGTELDSARFSFICCDPYLVFRSNGTHQTIEYESGTIYRQGDPFQVLDEILEGFDVVTEWSEAPFHAGGVGAFGYDLAHNIEKLPKTASDDLKLPDLVFIVYKTILIYDRRRKKSWIAALDYGAGAAERRGAAEKCISRFEKWIAAPVIADSPKSSGTSPLESNFSREQYVDSVKKCLEYIQAGDIYQVNLSQRFSAGLDVAPVDLYLKLARINPAPFSVYMDCDSFQLISSSPERFIKKTGRKIETKPIKGTRPRGKTAVEDMALSAELMESEKDNAELAMIVDLERNDFGRVCEFGTVRVARERVLETYATVFHLVSTVEGVLKKDCTIGELLRATFPGGSITGCPKIRSMEIIDELEPVTRGFYTGSIGYINFDGNMDLNIAIRTITVVGDKLYYNVGGGIVADSDPRAEYEETLDKGRAPAEAVKTASPMYDEKLVGFRRAGAVG